MKIDFYISSLSGGGAEHVLVNLASYLAEKGEDVSITSLEKRKQFYNIDKRVKVNKICSASSLSIVNAIKDYMGIRKNVKQRNADVSISFLSRTNILLIIASLFKKNKVVVCDRNNLKKNYSKLIYNLTWLTYIFSDVVCVQTESAKKAYPNYLQKKISVIENPLDFEELEEQCKGNLISQENTVISMGRLEDQKDFRTLIKAFAKTEVKWTDWKLDIWGQGKNQAGLKQLIHKLKQDGRIRLCGVTHTPFMEMKKAKIFVLSSFFEGFPNVLCEAMYASLPCIATDCEFGPSDIIEDGQNGLLVPVGDILKMYKKIDYLISCEEARSILGEKAHESIKTLDSSKVYRKWNDYIIEWAQK